MHWTFESLRSLRAEVPRVAERRGMRAVGVFRSISRGEAAETIDVGLLVQPEPGRSLLDLGGFAADLEEFLNCGVDVVSERGLRPRFRDPALPSLCTHGNPRSAGILRQPTARTAS